MTFVRAIENASLYDAGPSYARFPIVHVWGDAYTAGYAQGSIQKEYMNKFLLEVYAYFDGLAIDELPGPLPPAIQTIIIVSGLNAALDWTAKVTAPYTPQEFYDELHGLADGSGASYETLLRLNMFAELTKASCSFVGAWGSATVNGDDGHTYQLRALDYDTVGPFKDYVQITVYHPTEEGSQPFANIGWPGSIGIMTGFSSAQIGISEIGVTFPDDSFGQGTDNTPPEKVKGEPWAYILRDVMKYETDLASAVARIENSNRTCNLIIGVGSGKDAVVNGVEFSGYVAVPYNDSTLLPVNETWHPVIKDVVYNGMDWLCPNYDTVLAQQLQTYLGQIDEQRLIHNILPTVQTGDLHIAIYDLTASQIYVSFMRTAAGDTSYPLYAYERQFVHLDMKRIFATKPTTI